MTTARRTARVAWFVSNHGWGHLSRSTVAAEALLRRGHAVAMVLAPEMEATVRAALPRADVITGDLDRGYAFGAGGRGADAERTRALVRYATDVDDRVVAALSSWRPDVVLSDATPWAATVARTLGVPSAICSNFSWDTQYEALYGGMDDLQEALTTIRAHVERFDIALELPLGPGVPAVATRRAMPLLARHPSGDPPLLSGEGPLVMWAFGRTPIPDQPTDALRALAAICRERRLRLGATEAVAAAVPGVTAIPDTLYWPDVLTSARLVISKAGYSTLAETLRGPAHAVSFGVTGLPEERSMQREIEAAGYGIGIPLEEPDPAGALERAVAELLERPERKPITDDGTNAIADAIADLVAR